MMETKSIVKTILRLPQTVFSFKELLLLTKFSPEQLQRKLYYASKQGDLYQIRKGLYAANHQYNRLELATKIITPAYISFETVLTAAGVIFQYYDQIFVATYQSKTIVCDGQTYTFRKLKPTLLTNTQGIHIDGTYSVATTERAFLDIVYLNTRYYFDNLQPIDWDIVDKLLPVYENKQLEARVKKHFSLFEEQKNGH